MRSRLHMSKFRTGTWNAPQPGSRGEVLSRPHPNATVSMRERRLPTVSARQVPEDAVHTCGLLYTTQSRHFRTLATGPKLPETLLVTAGRAPRTHRSHPWCALDSDRVAYKTATAGRVHRRSWPHLSAWNAAPSSLCHDPNQHGLDKSEALYPGVNGRPQPVLRWLRAETHMPRHAVPRWSRHFPTKPTQTLQRRCLGICVATRGLLWA